MIVVLRESRSAVREKGNSLKNRPTGNFSMLGGHLLYHRFYVPLNNRPSECTLMPLLLLHSSQLNSLPNLNLILTTLLDAIKLHFYASK